MISFFQINTNAFSQIQSSLIAFSNIVFAFHAFFLSASLFPPSPIFHYSLIMITTLIW